ncbi:hypothetical protein P7C73_g5531, partial [Tremellales sp. Uapishka_1]
MCGLLLSIRAVSALEEPHRTVYESLQQCNRCRGPDSQISHTFRIVNEQNEELEVVLCASVLGLRGGGITSQPLKGKKGVLGWNGQVFQGLDIGEQENDTVRLMERLEDDEPIESVLGGIEGPYAFIYYQFATQTIHFQLDPLSRRSLLIHPPDSCKETKSSAFYLTSVRSDLCRENDLEMRALLGGEGGSIDLKKVRLGADGEVDASQGLVMKGHLPSDSGPFTRLTPTNAVIPSCSASEAESSARTEVKTFIRQVRDSVARRVENIPTLSEGEARVAVLFSGGIDCTFLAYLLDQCLPKNEPIDLINVAFAPPPQVLNDFEKKVLLKRQRKGVTTDDAEVDQSKQFDVPDRQTGRQSVAELRSVCPGREWRFVEIDVGYEESMQHRQRVVDLMYPTSTEMDISLAFPLYFASRGIGHLASKDGPSSPYTVKAKVYLSGLGADEQLGGYSRHRDAFFDRSWEGLIAETQMDILRLPTRNLSRDDRILSSHARDARYPYLDLSFVAYLSSLPIHLKCDPSLGKGIGDKRLLRLAADAAGLMLASSRKKQAMQFGTRSSRLGGGKGPGAGAMNIE